MSSLPVVTVVRPSPLPLAVTTSANSRADLIRLLSILVGLGASLAVNPDPIVTHILSQAAHLYRILYLPSPPPSSSSFAPVAYVESVVNSAVSYVDEQGVKLAMRQRLMEFDAQSPIDHRTLVKAAVGLVAAFTTRGLLRAMMR